jgi:hypothetical protein
MLPLVYINGSATVGGVTATLDTYGALLSLDFGSFIIGGYYAEHDGSAGGVNIDDSSWQAGIAFPDLFIEGSQLGVYYADGYSVVNAATGGRRPLTWLRVTTPYPSTSS